MAPDPAFYVLEENRKITTSKKSTRTIGLNLSPLSVVETQGTNSVSFTGSVVSLIKELCAIPRTEVLLIPHVVSPFSQNDNDLFFLEKIYDSLPSPLRDRVKIVDNKGYLGTKAFLRQCDVVVAARMHCAINAVCEGVPTIFLSYSQKAKGMAEFVYGSDHWVVPLNKMLQGVPLLVHEMLEKHQSIVSLLNSRLEDIKRERSAAVTEIKALLCDSSIRNRTNS
jgi:colanic acid/amylovoran biosynthesis protein